MADIFLGVVADDFTGASDAASFLVGAGVPTVLFNGVPKERPELKADTAAVVVALKTRTMPKDEAVAESMEAFSWLKELGAEKLYLKYCSTFDSTADGNIGPVADAVLERFGIPYTVLCPSLPVNGRTVRDGVLYVNGIRLEESHMKDHPLTPMRDSYIPKLMERQSRYRAFLDQGETERIAKMQEHFYLVPDYYEEEHADRIAERYWDLPFFTGGSGLAGALGRRYCRMKAAGISGDGDAAGRPDGGAGNGDAARVALDGGCAAAGGSPESDDADAGAAQDGTCAAADGSPENGGADAGVAQDGTCAAADGSPENGGAAIRTAQDGTCMAGSFGAATGGKALVLAGSCSAITLKQIADYQGKGRKSLRIWPDKLLEGTQTEAEILAWILAEESGALVYSSASPEELKESQKFGRDEVAEMLERTISSLARAAVEFGYTRIITAGGETSGAVTKALGYEAFYIGPSVAPGVPVMTPLENPGLRLVLKSGNFGQEDFFERAVRMTGEAAGGENAAGKAAAGKAVSGKAAAASEE